MVVQFSSHGPLLDKSLDAPPSNSSAGTLDPRSESADTHHMNPEAKVCGAPGVPAHSLGIFGRLVSFFHISRLASHDFILMPSRPEGR